MRYAVSGALLSLAVLACDSGDSAVDSYAVRDSAGIQIVESRASLWGGVPQFEIAAAPDIRIGVVEGAEPYRFYRIADATRLSDGRLVVADAGSGQIRTFGPDGVHHWTVGGLGDAPGEFKMIASLGLRGDSLVAFDRGASRLTAYSLTGELLWTSPVPMFYASAPAAIGAVRLLSDGRAFGVDASTMAPGVPPALVRDTAFVFEIPPEGAGTAPAVAAIPGMWTEHVVYNGQPGARSQPLTSAPTWDAYGTELHLTSGEAFEFTVVSSDGRVLRIVRRLEAAPAVSDQDAQAWRDLFLARAPEAQRPMVASMLAAFTIPTHLPVYARLLVDPAGNTWLGRFASPGLVPGRDWDVYATNGAYLGEVRMPADVEPLQIGIGHMLGKATDEMDVEYLQLHRVVRRER